jgi:hypothetical protein
MIMTTITIMTMTILGVVITIQGGPGLMTDIMIDMTITWTGTGMIIEDGGMDRGGEIMEDRGGEITTILMPPEDIPGDGALQSSAKTMISPMRKPLLRPRRKTTAEDDHLGKSIIEG